MATYLRCNGHCYVGLVANFLPFLAVKNSISVMFWPSCSKLHYARFGGQSADNEIMITFLISLTFGSDIVIDI